MSQTPLPPKVSDYCTFSDESSFDWSPKVNARLWLTWDVDTYTDESFRWWKGCGLDIYSWDVAIYSLGCG